MAQNKRRFENTEGKSKKFWQIERRDAALHLAWGRIGTAGQSKVKEFASVEKATAEYEKLIAEKLAKGYRETASEHVDAEGSGGVPADTEGSETAAAPSVDATALDGRLETVRAALKRKDVEEARAVLREIGGASYEPPAGLPPRIAAKFCELAGDMLLAASKTRASGRQAAAAYLRMIELERAAGESNEGLAHSYVRLAEAYVRAQDHTNAKPAFEEAQALIDGPGVPAVDRANVLTSCGAGFRALGERDLIYRNTAAELYRKAAPLWDEGGTATSSCWGWFMVALTLAEATELDMVRRRAVQGEREEALQRALAFGETAQLDSEELESIRSHLAQALADGVSTLYLGGDIEGGDRKHAELREHEVARLLDAEVWQSLARARENAVREAEAVRQADVAKTESDWATIDVNGEDVPIADFVRSHPRWLDDPELLRGLVLIPYSVAPKLPELTLPPHPLFDAWQGEIAATAALAASLRLDESRPPRDGESFARGTAAWLEEDAWPTCGGCSHPLTMCLQLRAPDLRPWFQTSRSLVAMYCFHCNPRSSEEASDGSCYLALVEPKVLVERAPDEYGQRVAVVTVGLPHWSIPDSEWFLRFAEEEPLGGACAAVMEVCEVAYDEWVEQAGETCPREWRTSIGGYPQWDQWDATPRCPRCSKLMQHLIDYNGEQFLDGSLHVFICDRAHELELQFFAEF